MWRFIVFLFVFTLSPGVVAAPVGRAKPICDPIAAAELGVLAVFENQPPSGGGVLIYYLRDEGPAKAGGLRVGDRITCVGLSPIGNYSDFKRTLFQLRPGAKVVIEYLRLDQPKIAVVQLIESDNKP